MSGRRRFDALLQFQQRLLPGADETFAGMIHVYDRPSVPETRKTSAVVSNALRLPATPQP